MFALQIFMRKFTNRSANLCEKPQQITQQKQNLHTIPYERIPRSHVNLIKLYHIYLIPPVYRKSGKHISFCNTSENPYPFNVTHKDFVGLFIYIFSKTWCVFFFPFFLVFLIFWLKHRLYIVYCVPVWC